MLTGLIWTAFGMTLSAAVLHAALGLRRPLHRTYLSFAAVMVLVAMYVYFESKLYRVSTSESAVESVRDEFVVALMFIGGILVFVPAYTRVRIPRLVMAAFWLALAILFVVNLWAPYGIWYSGPPVVRYNELHGEQYNTIIAPPMAFLQYALSVFAVSVFALTFWCAVTALRRGERQRGFALALALVLVIAFYLADVVRDTVGGAWPYTSEFGLVVWGLVMSSQLAIDFRTANHQLEKTLDELARHSADLTETIDATLRVRDKLNTPLQTLEIGLGMHRTISPVENEMLADLRRAVVELADLGRAVERAASPEKTETAA